MVISHDIRNKSLMPEKSVWAHENNIAHGSPRGYDRTQNSFKHTHTATKNNYNYKNEEPLKNSAHAQVNFKGSFRFSEVSNVQSLKNAFRFIPHHSEIKTEDYKKLLKYAEKNPQIKETLEKFCTEFTDEIKNNANFLKHLSTDVRAKAVNGQIICGAPQKSFIVRLGDALSSTFIMAPVSKGVKWIKNAIVKQEKSVADAIKREKKLCSNMAKVENLVEQIKFWEEKGYDDKLITKLLPKSLNNGVIKIKPPFSSSTLNISNRLVSGTISALYLGADAFNQVLYLSNNKDEANEEASSRFMQEGARVLLTAYVTGVVQNVFKKQCNNSMPFALGSALACVAVCETLGRTLIGKPILPTSKEKLEEMEKERKEHPDRITAKIGRLLTKDSAAKSSQKTKTTSEKHDDDHKEKHVDQKQQQPAYLQLVKKA